MAKTGDQCVVMNVKQREAEQTPRRSWRWLALVLSAAACVYLIWTQLLYPTHPARYKLTVEVETPAGLRIGSSVIEALYGWEPTLFGMISGVRNRVSGEAVFVDLGDGKNLVVTLTTNGTRRGLHPSGRVSALDALALPAAIFEFPTHDLTRTPDGIREAEKRGARAVSPEKLPTTVTFSDLSDPLSVKRVDPRNISGVLGEGYRLKSAWVQMTESPLTNRIGKRLEWLPHYYDKKLDGLKVETVDSAHRMANSLASSSFKTR